MSEEMRLNHPWMIYPNEPTSGYTKYSTYHRELFRLFYFIKKLSLNIDLTGDGKIQLTNFIIGTFMESALQNNHCSEIYNFQWQQLFPKHIYDFIKHYEKFDNDININIIIISPDNIFMDETYKEPLFTTMCEDYKFEKIQNREYIYCKDRLTIKVDIFTCPFPQLETRTSLIDHFNIFIEKYLKEFELENLLITDNDVKFIKDFYDIIELIASNPKSNLLLNSYAVFKNIMDFNNYGLFPTLLEIANKYKVIATEWICDESSHKSRIVSKINYTIDYVNYLVSYVEPYYTTSLKDYQKINTVELKKKPPNVCILIKFPYYRMVYRQHIM